MRVPHADVAYGPTSGKTPVSIHPGGTNDTAHKASARGPTVGRRTRRGGNPDDAGRIVPLAEQQTASLDFAPAPTRAPVDVGQDGLPGTFRDSVFGVKYFCRSTTTILAGSDGCSLDHARGWPDGWPRWRSGRSLGVAAGSEEAEDQTE